MHRHQITSKVRQITGTRKREFLLFERESPVDTGSYWSDGTKYNFVVININTGQQTKPPTGQYPTFKADYVLAENEIVIRLASCGKPSTPYIHCRPEDKENVLKWLGVS